MKLLCASHPRQELDTSVSRSRKAVLVERCPECAEQARKGGKQFALNQICKVFIDAIKEETDEKR